MTYAEWCAANDCSHGHCPEGCQKPQPCVGPDGRLYCARCLCLEGRESVMVPCVPETCED